jgi:hypothetical protein
MMKFGLAEQNFHCLRTKNRGDTVMRLTGLFAAMPLLLVSTICVAEKWHTSTISKVYPTANGNFVLIFKDDSALCRPDSTNSGKYYWVENGQNGINEAGRDKIYAVALAAAVSGKTVKVAFDETQDKCFINRLQVVFD